MKIGIGVFPLSDPRTEIGSKRIHLDLAIGLARKGHEVTVYATDPSDGVPTRSMYRGPVYEYLERQRFLPRLLGTRLSKNFDLPFTISLLRETIFKRLDAFISVNDTHPFFVRNMGVRALSLHVLPPFFHPARNARVRRILKGDICICCSRFLADTTSKLFPDVSDEFTFVYNGVDCKRLSRGDGETTRRRLNIPSDHFVILFVGAIVELKGVVHLVRAFREFHQQIPKSSLVLVGGKNLWLDAGSDAYYDQVVMESAGLPVSIVNRASYEEMPDYYAMGDILVCPSTGSDVAPLVIMEAMSAGKPVVASRLGGIPEMVSDGETGYLVTPGDSSSIREKLIELSQDEDLRTSMGEKGRKVAEASFSIEQMVDGYLSKLN